MDRVEKGAVGRARRIEALVHSDRKSDQDLWCWRCRCQTHHCPRLDTLSLSFFSLLSHSFFSLTTHLNFLSPFIVLSLSFCLGFYTEKRALYIYIYTYKYK